MCAKKRMSIREIAHLCNVSPSTVSRIANGTGSFSEETRRLVLDAMQREGYTVPQGHSTSTAWVGALFPEYENDYYAELLSALTVRLAEAGIFLTASACPDQESTEAALVELYNRGAAGVFLLRFHADLPEIIPPDYPMVFCDPYAWGAYSVSSDDYVGGQLAAQEFLRRGCTRPIILNNRNRPLDSPRLAGFLYEFEQAGHRVGREFIIAAETNKSGFHSAKDAVTYLWAKGTQFDSVYACSDWRAYGALTALQNMGVRVPEDVKLIGYDGTRVSQYGATPVTTIRQNIPAIAQATCNLMRALLNKEPIEEPQVTIPILLQQGRTT